MKKIINITACLIVVCITIQHAYSQAVTPANMIDFKTNQSVKQKDSIIKHQWNPISVADSLLFDGTTQYTFPKTTLTFTPPKTFRADADGNIIHDWTGASIQCSIIQSPYNLMIKSVNKTTFEKQGFTYINQETITTNKKVEGTIYLIAFKSNNIEYERMVCFIGNGTETAWISINYPVIMKNLLYEILEHSLATVEF